MIFDNLNLLLYLFVRFPMGKFKYLKDSIVNSGIYKGPFIKPPHPLEVPDGILPVYAVHDKDYVDRFCAGLLTNDEIRRIGLDFSGELVYRTMAEVGGTMHTADLALEYGMAINLAGGTHHAHYNFGSGFTVINDLAVAARRAVELKGLQSVLIFDLDVHQGDGTAAIFANDNNVFTVSIHCEVNFPFRKSKSNIDVGLPAGTTDVEYMAAVRKTLQEAIDICKPDLVIYDAGILN